MSLLAGTLASDHLTHFATSESTVFSVHLEKPMPDFVTLAVSDGDNRSVMLVPRALFDRALRYYSGNL